MARSVSDAAGIAVADPSGTGREAAMRARILTAARECFERFGVARTRVEDIARGAGISRPLLYQYFDGRPALIDAMIIDELHRLVDELRSQIPEKNFVDTFVELSVSSVSLGRSDNLLDDLFNNSASFSDAATLMEHQGSPVHGLLLGLWSPILEQGRREGVLRTDVDDDELVEWLMMMHTVFHVRRDISLERMDEMFRRFVLNGFVVQSSLPA